MVYRHATALMAALLSSSMLWADGPKSSEQKILENNGYNFSGMNPSYTDFKAMAEFVILGRKADADRYYNDLKAAGGLSGKAAADEIKRLQDELARARAAGAGAGGGAAGGGPGVPGGGGGPAPVPAPGGGGPVPAGGGPGVPGGGGGPVPAPGGGGGPAPVPAGGPGAAPAPMDDAERQGLLDTITQLRREIAALTARLAAGGPVDMGNIDPQLKRNLDDYAAKLNDIGQPFDANKLNDLITEINVGDSEEGATYLLQKFDELSQKTTRLSNEASQARNAGNIADAQQKEKEATTLFQKIQEIYNVFTGKPGTFGRLYKAQEAKKMKLEREALIDASEAVFNEMKAKGEAEWSSPFYYYLQMDQRGFASLNPTEFEKLRRITTTMTEKESGAILYMTSRVIKFNLKSADDVESMKNPKFAFLGGVLDRYKAFRDGKAPSVIDAKSLGENDPTFVLWRDVFRFLKSKVPINYAVLSQQIKNDNDYQNDHQNVMANFIAEEKDSPLLLLIKDKNLSDYKDLSDFYISQIKGFYKHTSVAHLRTILYVLSDQVADPKTPENIKRFYSSMIQEVENRVTLNKLHAEPATKVDIDLIKKGIEKARDGQDAGPAAPSYDPTFFNDLKTRVAPFAAAKNTVMQGNYIQANKNDAPLLTLFEIDMDKFKDIGNQEVNAIIKVFEFSTTTELKALIYTLSENEDLFSKNFEEMKKLTEAIEKAIKDRKIGENDRPKKAKLPDRMTFKGIVNNL